MQSQQKRVKWSRGETAEALEERTDTGITQASVELMENCIPDIYGNISRRPWLELIDYGDTYTPATAGSLIGFEHDTGIQYAVFYITENDFIICAIHTHAQPEFIRIKDNTMVCKRVGVDTSCWNGVLDNNGVWTSKVISYAQQNNYMIIATATNVYKLQVEVSSSDNTFEIAIEPWQFSAGWYAREGTRTRSVSDSDVTGLNFSGGFTTEPFTDTSGMTTSYSQISTGVSGADFTALTTQIPAGSIVQMPNIGCYFRIEGYSLDDGNLVFQDQVFDGALNSTDTVPATGKYCKSVVRTQTVIIMGHPTTIRTGILEIYVDGVIQSDEFAATDGVTVVIKNAASTTGLSVSTWSAHTIGSGWLNWADTTASATISAYGALLTPVADDTASDTTVTVEYGYESLQPTYFGAQTFPHPKKVVFNDQRLWAGGWAYSITQEYALVIGSQIARYGDFKNDYNQENEPITLDILTQFKERILHLVDYNGLKIFTDAYEYAYSGGGVVKQSSNGAYENCNPLVFESLCLYVDSTGQQVKAMQYEFQSNIFNSTSVNQMAPHDLVGYPHSMAAYEDKVNATGKYLFLVNSNNSPRVAVCNFVPGNQANIWNRWTFPYSRAGVPMIDAVVNTKTEPIFMVNMTLYNDTDDETVGHIILPALMNFASWTYTGDFDVSTIDKTVTSPQWLAIEHSGKSYRAALPGATISVYNITQSPVVNTYQWLDTLDEKGRFTKSISGLSGMVHTGLPINAVIRSHPIDVGGKTKSIKKRIGKAQMSVHSTNAGAITINGKTGYMNPAKDHICFYGVTGMKNEIKYTITNNNGAMFHLESLLMNIEYGTLIS